MLAAFVLWASYVPVPVRGRLDAVSPFVLLVALRPLLAVLLLAAAAAALVAVRAGRLPFGPPVLVLAAAVLAVAQIAPRALGSAPTAPATAPRLTVLEANTLQSTVQPATIAALAGRTGADIVTLPETNGARAAEYAGALSTAQGQPWVAFSDPRLSPQDPSARPTSMLVRAALAPVQLADPGIAFWAHGQVRVRLGAAGPGGRALDVAAVHALPPTPAGTVPGWRRDLLALRPLCRSGWVIAGDFNATVDHSPLRSVLHAGCRDAADATGHGLTATWSGGPLGLLRPVIDHVLSSGGVRPLRSGILPLAGSDHRAFWAQLALTG